MLPSSQKLLLLMMIIISTCCLFICGRLKAIPDLLAAAVSVLASLADSE